MKIVLSLVLAFSTLLRPQISYASAESEAWKMYLSHVAVEYKRAVDYQDFITKMGASFHADDKSYLRRAVAKNVKWPALTVRNNRIYLTDGKATVWIEKLDGSKFLINGKVLNYDPKKPVIVQMRKLFVPAVAENHASPFLYRLFVSEASAMEPVTMVALGSTMAGQGAEGLGLAMMASGVAEGSATAGTAAAVAGGASAGAMVAVTAAVVVGAAAIVGGVYCAREATMKTENRWDAFLNCASSPLSWFGVNPRDTLRVSEVRCSLKPAGEKSLISVQLTSDRGARESRSFTFEEGKALESVQIDSFAEKDDKENRFLAAKFDDDGSLKSTEISRAKLGGATIKQNLDSKKNKDQWSDISKIGGDMAYYQSLCKDSKRLQEFNGAAKEYGKEAPVSVKKIPAAEADGVK